MMRSSVWDRGDTQWPVLSALRMLVGALSRQPRRGALRCGAGAHTHQLEWPLQCGGEGRHRGSRKNVRRDAAHALASIRVPRSAASDLCLDLDMGIYEVRLPPIAEARRFCQPQKCGLRDQRKRGLRDQRKRGLRDLQKCGLRDQRKRGLRDQRKRGLRDLRKCGLRDLRKCGKVEGKRSAW
jgi:hypothetical protein